MFNSLDEDVTRNNGGNVLEPEHTRRRQHKGTTQTNPTQSRGISRQEPHITSIVPLRSLFEAEPNFTSGLDSVQFDGQNDATF